MAEPLTPALTTVRRLTANNVHETAGLLSTDLAVPPLSDTEAITACRALLLDGSMTGVLVESSDSTGRPRIVGLGGAVFVSKQFVDRERAHPEPGLAERVLASTLRGRSVALSRRRLAVANQTTGLHVAVVLHSWPGDISEALLPEIRHHLAASFVSNLRGYHLAEIIGEVSGRADLRWALTGGFNVRSDYADWYKQRADPQPRRSLIGITRAEALTHQGSVLSLMFHYAPPRLGFTPRSASPPP